jgi:lipoyl(octanoyl) transferase
MIISGRNEINLPIMQEVLYRDLGKIGYKDAWDYQEMLLKENVNIKSDHIRMSQKSGEGVTGQPVIALPTVNYLLLLEHPPVYTLGKSGHAEHILISESEMEERGIAFFQTNRGGDITFHGPGQLVGYPILDLEKFYTDIGRYLRNLEEVIILTLAEYGIKGNRSSGETGVWLDPELKGRERKICAMGVRCSRWITMHGFALNVNTDLAYFENIIPCGIRNKQVTSLQQELGRSIDLQEVKDSIQRNFQKVFEVRFT